MSRLAADHPADAHVVSGVDASVGAGFDLVSHGMFLFGYVF